MGYAKDMLIEAEERGWSSIDKVVCADCLSDEDLQAVVTRVGDQDGPCSYCGKSPAVPLDEIMKVLDAGIRTEWQDARDAGLFWDGREDGYQGTKVIDNHDFFQDVVDPFENDDLRRDVVGAYFSQGTEWVRIDFWRLPDHQVLANGWESFVDTVKYDSRFVFLADPQALKDHGDDHLPPGRFPEALAELAMRLGLVIELPAGSAFHRARLHVADESIPLPDGLAAPRDRDARFPNRMSPVGIPMFYGARDLETCVAELKDPSRPSSRCTAAAFLTPRPIRVLDLTRIPPTPGLFAPRSPLKNERPNLRFLNDFLQDISRPVKKDELANVEYVPTQIVTEYFRRIVRCGDGARVSGILYPSAVRPGGVCCVLFFKNEQTCMIRPGWDTEKEKSVIGEGPPRWWLGLDPASVKTFSP